MCINIFNLTHSFRAVVNVNCFRGSNLRNFMQQTQPLRCRARHIPASTKFVDLFMQQGPGCLFMCLLILWYHCDDKNITETNLLTLSNNIYLMFYAKEIDIGT